MVALPMLEVVRSNRLERLVERLAQRLDAEPLADPMRVETIAVPSRGMERWLAQRLSQRLGASDARGGICAHVEFPFPAKIVRQLLDAVEGEGGPAHLDAGLDAGPAAGPSEGESKWEPDAMTWAVLAGLAELIEQREFAPLARYLGGGAESLRAAVNPRAYAIARAIAASFDRYALHRPYLVRALVDPKARPALADFGAREDDMWQGPLWRSLAARLGGKSFASRLFDARKRLHAAKISPELLPARVSIFGLAALPAAQLEALDALSRHVPVSLYLLAPSEAYWADIRSRREQLRALGSKSSTIDPADLARVEGHPLLASLGTVARDFQVVLERSVENYQDHGVFEDPVELFEDAGAAPTMLAQLQSDILQLRNRGAAVVDARGLDLHAPPATVAADDHSIEIHACHGDLRQVQVLRDRLLALFEENPSLEARDVLVISPDIERFAPLIPAVFEPASAPTAGSSRLARLPVFVADRSLAVSNPVAAAMLDLLALVGERVSAPALLDFLANEVVRMRFDIEADEIEQVRGWVEAAGARWGIDAEDRASFDQPAQYAFTWAFALDRLALGVAMADPTQSGERGEDETPPDFEGRLPFDDLEGSAVDLFARFTVFCERLFEVCRSLRTPRQLDEWGQALYEAVDGLFATPEGRRWWALDLRRELDEMLADAGEFEIPIELAVVRKRLEERLSRGRGAVGHHTGAITFCAMAPMRSVPHPVVCLLGMSDGAFPRESRRQDFDLLARRPHLGDPNPRDEDRFLLLEAILAARARMIITYEGRDAQRNEALPPAVPIAELIDQLERAFRVEGEHGRETSVRAHLVTEHALDLDDPRYYDAQRQSPGLDLRRFDAAGAEVARARRSRSAQGWSAPRRAPLEGREMPKELELDRFIKDLSDPARAYLRYGLDVRLPYDDEGLQAREPVEVKGLDRWRLTRAQLDAQLESWLGARTASDDAALLQARGLLPPGPPGRAALRSIEAGLRDCLARLKMPIDSAAVRDRIRSEVRRVEIDGLLLSGHVWIDDGTRQLVVDTNEDSGKLRLQSWIAHLFACASASGPAGLPTHVGADKGAYVWPPCTPSEARAQLEVWVRAWRSAARSPLAFAPKTAWSCVAAEASAGDERVPEAAIGEFEGNNYAGGERDKPEFVFVWGKVPTLEAFVDETDFLAQARALFEPAARAAREAEEA